MPHATLVGRIEDPAVKECRDALKSHGFEITFRPYYGAAYNPHEFPIVTHDQRSYHSTREVYDFLAKYGTRQSQKPETKVISSVQTPERK